MTDETYNGWSNWETWCANLWLGNDWGVYLMCQERTVDAVESDYEPRPPESWAWRAGAALKEMVEECADEGIRLIGDEMSMHRIDWSEIGEHWAEDYREAQGYEATA